MHTVPAARISIWVNRYRATRGCGFDDDRDMRSESTSELQLVLSSAMESSADTIFENFCLVFGFLGLGDTPHVGFNVAATVDAAATLDAAILANAATRCARRPDGGMASTPTANPAGPGFYSPGC